MRLRCSAACAPGLEGLVAAELAEIGVRAQVAAPARVAFSATPRQLYAVCLRSAVASRVLVQVARFTARTFADLEREADAIDWSPWTPGGGAFRVTTAKSRLIHTGAVAERLQRAAGGPGQMPFVVRIDHDHVTISADAGGDPLHRRGWRLDTAKAPLRPTLAAAALRTIGWDGTTTLVDPLCGSGTIAIEAAGMAAGLAPGRLRSFAFESWPSFAPGTWASVQGELRGAARQPSVTILAADRDAGACRAAAGNAARAGVTIEVRQQPLSALEPPPGPGSAAPQGRSGRGSAALQGRSGRGSAALQGRSGRGSAALQGRSGRAGWLVTNPPWGGRTAHRSSVDLRDLHAALGDLVRERFAGWGVALLVADPRLALASGLPLEHRWSTLAGGTRVHLMAAPGSLIDDEDPAA